MINNWYKFQTKKVHELKQKKIYVDIHKNAPFYHFQTSLAYIWKKKKMYESNYYKNVIIAKATYREACITISDLITKNFKFMK